MGRGQRHAAQRRQHRAGRHHAAAAPSIHRQAGDGRDQRHGHDGGREAAIDSGRVPAQAGGDRRTERADQVEGDAPADQLGQAQADDGPGADRWTDGSGDRQLAGRVPGGLTAGPAAWRRRHQRALHQHRVAPFAMLVSDRPQRAHGMEALAGVQRQRGRVAAVAHHGQHLAPAGRGAALDQRGQQLAADAESAAAGLHVDRVFHRVAVGRARAVRRGVGIAHHLAVDFGHQVEHALGQHGGAALAHFLDGRRVQLEGGGAVQHMMGVDGLDGGQVGVDAVADEESGGGHGRLGAGIKTAEEVPSDRAAGIRADGAIQ